MKNKQIREKLKRNGIIVLGYYGNREYRFYDTYSKRLNYLRYSEALKFYGLK